MRFAAWIHELGGCKGHRLLLIEDERCKGSPLADEYRKSFDDVQVLPFTDRWNRWPHSANACFKQAAWHIEGTSREPWFFIEPDCVALKSGWLDALEQEYKEGGHPFLGDYVHVGEIPVHMSGNAIYPGELSKHAGAMMLSDDIAFDMMGAGDTVTHMTRSKLLMHAWKHPRFDNWQHIEREIFAFKPECVLFHADKAGSIYPLLRDRMGLPESQAYRTSPLSLAEQGKTTDILIKSYPPDFERLRYCLRSIAKFASGFRNVVVIVPQGAKQQLLAMQIGLDAITVHEVAETGDGYLFQQTIKASAHEWTDADFILHIDSDCFVTTPITPELFTRENKPIWYMTPYSSIAAPWQPIVEKFIGPPVEFEFMRRLPFLSTRKLHLGLAQFCEQTHGMRLTDYIMNQPGHEFSEFNVLGALAFAKMPEDYFWVDTTKEELPTLTMTQYWSREPLTEEKKAEFESALKDSATSHGTQGEPAALVSCFTKHETAVAELPIEPGVFPEGMGEVTKAPREVLIRSAVSSLKQFCTAPRFTSQVRKELKKQGVIR